MTHSLRNVTFMRKTMEKAVRQQPNLCIDYSYWSSVFWRISRVTHTHTHTEMQTQVCVNVTGLYYSTLIRRLIQLVWSVQLCVPAQQNLSSSVCLRFNMSSYMTNNFKPSTLLSHINTAKPHIFNINDTLQAQRTLLLWRNLIFHFDYSQFFPVFWIMHWLDPYVKMNGKCTG